MVYLILLSDRFRLSPARERLEKIACASATKPLLAAETAP